ncbi:DUF3822 family protein [Flavobacterium sp. ASW18X]|uniref:DUF3822 family protein n=1 Tax=Flavobacterium sp. ASW18X TaxID=2572595 RepID=UPI0010AED2F6|nr:DUF3822 family protein [Flavobacterium sp. ASW18X]TKD63421.1 DUF3822 family protein [Flavobacterium sp. ASW18X]
MIERQKINGVNNPNTTFKKLSIQVSLNGLSFCIQDTVSLQLEEMEQKFFKTELTPYLVLKELKALVEHHKLAEREFTEVVVLHRNNLYSLVPVALFDKNELANYLKFNTKILATDQIVHDQIPNTEMVCVYVPFTNINNYLFTLFGEFEYKHASVSLLQTLLQNSSATTTCYVHVTPTQLEMAVLEQKNLILYNQFTYQVKEDFLYYILFTYEQLGLNVASTPLKLFGAITTEDNNYKLCYEYIKDVTVFRPEEGTYNIAEAKAHLLDYSLLSTL